MANRDAAYGARPVMTLGGVPYAGQTVEVVFLATQGTNCFVGDFVTITNGDTNGVPAVTRSAATSGTIFGAVTAFLPNFDDEGSLLDNHRIASTLRRALVCPAHGMIFSMQSDEDTTALTVNEINENCDLIVADGSTITGQSVMEIDASTTGTATALVRLHGLEQEPGNVFGSTAAGDRANWLISVNEPTFNLAAGS